LPGNRLVIYLPGGTMDIHEQVDEVLAQVAPQEKQATTYDKERAKWYVEQAIARQEPGEWELADIKSLVMENPMPGMYSLQFWFVVLVDEKNQCVTGEIFSERRD
jgi:hypothetical protein